MKYVRLGNTGLEVSRICLGCMSFGVKGKGWHPWVLEEAASRELIRQALDSGINFFDTANSYSEGTSEEITGRALNDMARRDQVVIATKVWGPWGKAPNQRGLSRKAIHQAIDDSLRRLGTDYVDLYQIHRWDPSTPIEETLDALNDLVRAGKVRYLGASSMYAWQLAKALFTSAANGWARFVSMQNYVNLLYREEEREMIPLCRDQGVGLIPWSPLARGRLTRAWDEKTERSESDAFGRQLYAATAGNDRQIVEAVAKVATARGVPRAQVALAWVLQKPGVTAPIVGVTKPHHVSDAVAALDVALTDEEIAQLEEPYLPHPVTGH
jgi:aryl-alcohol dehydrogenase-like predicted oxidoreductase